MPNYAKNKPGVKLCFFFFSLNICYISSLCHRHQRAAVHPADRDEDEQERTAGTRERQRDPGLTLDLFTLLTLQPLTLDRPALSTPLLTLDSTAPGQKRQSQSPARTIGRRHIRRCLQTTLFFHFLIPLSPLLCCGSSPLDADSRANV